MTYRIRAWLGGVLVTAVVVDAEASDDAAIAIDHALAGVAYDRLEIDPIADVREAAA